MDITLSTENLSTGETIGFYLSLLGSIIISGLAVKATVTQGVVPTYERQLFNIVFFATITILGGVVLSYYTTVFTQVSEKIRQIDSDEQE